MWCIGRAVIKRWLPWRSPPGSGTGKAFARDVEDYLRTYPRTEKLSRWAQVVDVSRLSDRTARHIEDYLRTYRRMNGLASVELTFRLKAAVDAQVSPPPPIDIPPLDVFATVLEVRHKQPGIG